jgi:peptidylprolyl isomerase
LASTHTHAQRLAPAAPSSPPLSREEAEPRNDSLEGAEASSDEASQNAQPLSATSLYHPPAGPVLITIAAPSKARANRALVLLVASEPDAPETDSVQPLDPRPRTLTTIPLAAQGEIVLDLLAPLAGALEGGAEKALFAQLVEDGVPVGAALVIEPLWQRPEFIDGYSLQVLAALAARDQPSLQSLLNMPAAQRETLRQTCLPRSSTPPLHTGWRVWRDERLVLETSAGPLVLALRPDCAPATVFHIRRLVSEGFYTGLSFHRVLREDSQGRPYLVQTGDPTSTGAGGAGARLDFEPSPLPHSFGVASMARRPGDPGSASSQFFLCLSRGACAGLDGLYTSFATLVEGADVLRTIAAAPTFPVEEAGLAGKPIEPVIIERATLVPAPPKTIGPGTASERTELATERPATDREPAVQR